MLSRLSSTTECSHKEFDQQFASSHSIQVFSPESFGHLQESQWLHSNLLIEESVKSDFVLNPMINETKQNLDYDMHHLFNLGPPVNLTSIL